MVSATQYLIAVYIAQQQEPGPISPSTIATTVEKSPAATTEMLQRLADRGLVSYEPYEGVTLTTHGRDVAAKRFETYVTLSWFFRDVLGLNDHETDAMRLAGSVSPLVADRLATWLLNDEPTDDGPPPKVQRDR